MGAGEAWPPTVLTAEQNRAGLSQLKGSAKLIPRGSTQSDLSLEFRTPWPRLDADFFVQYEKSTCRSWPAPQNLSSLIQLTWEPTSQISEKELDRSDTTNPILTWRARRHMDSSLGPPGSCPALFRFGTPVRGCLPCCRRYSCLQPPASRQDTGDAQIRTLRSPRRHARAGRQVHGSTRLFAARVPDWQRLPPATFPRLPVSREAADRTQHPAPLRRPRRSAWCLRPPLCPRPRPPAPPTDFQRS